VKLEQASLLITRIKRTTLMKKRRSKKMENPHEDQLKIKSSKLLSNYKYIKKLRSRWISGQCIIVFEKN